MGVDENGHPTTQSVADGNKMMHRMVLLLYLLSAHCILWSVEQPASSLLFDAARFVELTQRLATYGQKTWLGMFGASTPKPIKLVSNAKEIRQLDRRLQRGRFQSSTEQQVFTNDDHGVSGGPMLKETQVYPWGFAEGYFQMVHSVDFETLLIELPAGRSFNPQEVDSWQDEADVKQLADFLGVPFDRVIA